MKILLFALLLSLPANACLWLNGTTLDGKDGRIEGHYPADGLREAMASLPEDKFDKHLRNRNRADFDAFTAQEAEAIQRIFEGDYGDAIAILQEIENKEPGGYSTAVNLGTAYELLGDLETALKWITEGILRNPKSHYGTEWLHVEILKIKIKLQANPGYLQNHHVIELPDRFTQSSKMEIEGRSFSMGEIGESILYQLRERLVFVKPPDPVVADLLFTYGQIEAVSRIVESGIKLFKLADEYGYPHSEQIAAMIAGYEKVHRDRERMVRNREFAWKIGGVSVVVGFFLFLIIAWKKKWFFLSKKTYLKDRVSRNL